MPPCVRVRCFSPISTYTCCAILIALQRSFCRSGTLTHHEAWIQVNLGKTEVWNGCPFFFGEYKMFFLGYKKPFLGYFFWGDSKNLFWDTIFFWDTKCFFRDTKCFFRNTKSFFREAGPPNISLFFPSPATIFILSSSLGGRFVYVHVWSSRAVEAAAKATRTARKTAHNKKPASSSSKKWHKQHKK